jgi:ABC transporter substrate binding protein
VNKRCHCNEHRLVGNETDCCEIARQLYREVRRDARRNVKIDYRFATRDADQVRQYAAELVALRPDVILATGSLVTAALLQVTRSVPIVFAQLPDPAGNGLVASLARPRGNATGFTNYECSMSGRFRRRGHRRTCLRCRYNEGRRLRARRFQQAYGLGGARES